MFSIFTIIQILTALLNVFIFQIPSINTNFNLLVNKVATIASSAHKLEAFQIFLSNCWNMTFYQEGGLISRHSFFPVLNCSTEICGSYDWPVASLTCLNDYTYYLAYYSIPLLCISTCECMLENDQKHWEMMKKVLFPSCTREANVRRMKKSKEKS